MSEHRHDSSCVDRDDNVLDDHQPGGSEREKDLTDALQSLVAHYERFIKHRCEILDDAHAVLRGEPYPRFAIPEDLHD